LNDRHEQMGKWDGLGSEAIQNHVHSIKEKAQVYAHLLVLEEPNSS